MLTTIINNTKWFIKINNHHHPEVQIGFICNLNEDNNVKFDKEIILGIGKSKWNLNDKYDSLYGISLSTCRAVNQVSIALASLNPHLSDNNINIVVELIRFLARKVPNIIKKIDTEIINDIELYKIKEY
jgi:hypothetical protein